MSYTQLIVTCPLDFSEILMAEIAEAGFDTLMETETGFEAYCEEGQHDQDKVVEIGERYSFVKPFELAFNRIEKQNWNEEWEKNVEPITVDEQCLVRAEFHKIEQKYPYEIIITPKMSFGTGHHQTTYLMLKAQLQIDHEGNRVMDAGCGTAILSIMASKRGAVFIDAFDIDEWSVTNGTENVEKNSCANVRIRQGKISELSFDKPFEIILANINKNILLDEIKLYNKHLIESGTLLLSGFYQDDIDILKAECEKYRLIEVIRFEKDNWAALQLKRNP